MQKYFTFSFLLIAPLFLSGCGLVGAVEEFGCGFISGKDQDHCYQDAAVRRDNFDTCDKIKAETFTEAQGPATKDKCYVRVAEQTGDPSGCDRIVGGMISYSEEECLQRAAITANDPSICDMIEGSHSSMSGSYSRQDCLTELGMDDYEGDTGSESGTCKYDSDCDPICDGNVAWKMGCNARTNSCEKTFDTNCSETKDAYGTLTFRQICSAGQCVTDEETIAATKAKLEADKKAASDNVKDINARRDDLKNVMLDTNKNCINGIADMTNVAIMEFSTRIASLMAGGLPSAADAAVDYAGDALNKLYAYSDGTPPEDQKLKPDEYIKLNCDLYNFFKSELAASDQELDDALEEAKTIDTQLDALP